MRLAISCAELRHHIQYVQQAGTVGQCALTGQLNYGAIRHGVGEGNTQFQNIGTGCNHGVQQRHRHRGRRIACGDVGNQRLAPGRL
jgi:hypothetical protein